MDLVNNFQPVIEYMRYKPGPLIWDLW